MSRVGRIELYWEAATTPSDEDARKLDAQLQQHREELAERCSALECGTLPKQLIFQCMDYLVGSLSFTAAPTNVVARNDPYAWRPTQGGHEIGRALLSRSSNLEWRLSSGSPNNVEAVVMARYLAYDAKPLDT